jgi:hypothetical protein
LLQICDIADRVISANRVISQGELTGRQKTNSIVRMLRHVWQTSHLRPQAPNGNPAKLKGAYRRARGVVVKQAQEDPELRRGAVAILKSVFLAAVRFLAFPAGQVSRVQNSAIHLAKARSTGILWTNIPIR